MNVKAVAALGASTGSAANQVRLAAVDAMAQASIDFAAQQPGSSPPKLWRPSRSSSRDLRLNRSFYPQASATRIGCSTNPAARESTPCDRLGPR